MRLRTTRFLSRCPSDGGVTARGCAAAKTHLAGTSRVQVTLVPETK